MTGVIIARLQPIHNGHIELIKQAMNENDNILIWVGSADKLNKRNPIPIKRRLELIQEALKEIFPDGRERNRIEVKAMPDLTDETDNSYDWGFYLHSHIVDFIGESKYTIYYSDGFEIIMSWFPKYVTEKFVSFKLNARGSIHDNLSATKVRKWIVDGEDEKLREAVPNCVYEKRELLRDFIESFD